MASTIAAGTTSGTAIAIAGDTSGVLQLQTNGTTAAVTIDTSQNVGIGTTSPAAPADVVSNSNAIAVSMRGRASDDACVIRWISNNGSTVNGRIQVNSGGDMIFQNTNSITERMRIDSSGNVGIGANTVSTIKTYISAASNQAVLYARAENASQTQGVLQVEAARNTTNNTFYAIQYYNAGAGTDRFRVADSGNVTNTNNSYGSISDIKLKENIVDASPKLEKLCQVKVRNFNIIGDEQKQLGVVAQELEQIFPSMIEESPDKDIDGNDLGTTTKLVKYSVFVPMLIKAMQEQQAMITELNAKVDAQAVRIAELEGAK